MRTTITIDDQMILDLMRESQARSRSDAIRQAVEAYLDRKRREKFKALAGSRLSDLDWEATEDAELDELNRE